MNEFILTFSAIIIHEAGHFIAALLLRIPVRGIGYSAAGPKIRFGRVLSYSEEAITAGAGPLMNILTGVAVLPFADHNNCLYFAVTSMFLAVLNLLPFKDTDGFRLLGFILCRLPQDISENIRSFCSLFTVILFWLTGVYLLIRTGSAILLFVFSIIMFAETVLPQK